MVLLLGHWKHLIISSRYAKDLSAVSAPNLVSSVKVGLKNPSATRFQFSLFFFFLFFTSRGWWHIDSVFSAKPLPMNCSWAREEVVVYGFGVILRGNTSV